MSAIPRIAEVIEHEMRAMAIQGHPLVMQFAEEGCTHAKEALQFREDFHAFLKKGKPKGEARCENRPTVKHEDLSEEAQRENWEKYLRIAHDELWLRWLLPKLGGELQSLTVGAFAREEEEEVSIDVLAKKWEEVKKNHKPSPRRRLAQVSSVIWLGTKEKPINLIDPSCVSVPQLEGKMHYRFTAGGMVNGGKWDDEGGYLGAFRRDLKTERCRDGNPASTAIGVEDDVLIFSLMKTHGPGYYRVILTEKAD